MPYIDDDRFGELLVAQRKLQALERAGVDKWEWYDYAMEIIDNEDDEDNSEYRCGIAYEACEECYNESEEEADARHKEDKKDEDVG